MKTSLPAFVPNVAASAPQELPASNVKENKFPSGNFNDHLSSAEAKRLHAKPPVKAKAAPSPRAAKSVSRESHHEPARSMTAKPSPKDPKGIPELSPEPIEESEMLANLPDESPKPLVNHAVTSLLEALCDNAEETTPEDEVPLTVPLPETAAFAPTLVGMSAQEIQQPSTQLTTKAPEISTAPVRAIEETLKEIGRPEGDEAVSKDKTSAHGKGVRKERAVPPDTTGEGIDSANFEEGNSPEFDPKDSPLDLGEIFQPPDSSLTPRLSEPEEKSPSLLDGTAAAKQTLPMNNTVEMDKVAGSTVKNLPGTDRTLDLPASRAISHVEPSREVRQELSRDAAMNHVALTTTASTGATLRTEDSVPAAAIPAVERVARAVLDGVAHVRKTGNESVSVVLKPDAGTELLLRVEMRDGAVSAQLHFERGDRSILDQHWDELQQRLAGQGVQLTRDDVAAFNGNAQSQHRSFVPDRDATRGFDQSMSAKKNSTNTVVAPQRTARGFETWA